jgi:hypothetical protein
MLWQSFFDENQPRVSFLSHELEDINNNLKKLLAMYGASAMTYVEFMTCVNAFVVGFGRAIDDAAKVKAQNEKFSQKKGVMDHALKNLSAGKY